MQMYIVYVHTMYVCMYVCMYVHVHPTSISFVHHPCVSVHVRTYEYYMCIYSAIIIANTYSELSLFVLLFLLVVLAKPTNASIIQPVVVHKIALWERHAKLHAGRHSTDSVCFHS